MEQQPALNGGTNTNGLYCHLATGHLMPSILIFNRKRMADSLKSDAPSGAVFACADSGGIDSDTSIHFIQSVNAGPQSKRLLLLVGHASHSKNLDAIKLARENGVHILSFPAHTTHRLQPKDVAFFKSLKSWFNIEIEIISGQAKPRLRAHTKWAAWWADFCLFVCWGFFFFCLTLQQ